MVGEVADDMLVVDDRVKAGDDKIVAVNDGAKNIFYTS